MRILSVKQPWAGLIVAGLKDVENRSQSCGYLGPLLIHASLQPDADAVSALRRHKLFPVDRKRLPALCTLTGGIIGVVNMWGCAQISGSKWFFGPYGWLLADARPLPFTPHRGTLSLQKPSDELLTRLGLL